MRTAPRRALSVCVAVVAIGGIVSVGIVTLTRDNRETLPAAASVDQQVGKRIAAYLGNDITPSRWTQLMEPYQAGVEKCLAGAGFAPREMAKPSPDDDLRVADPAAFASKYGYGVTLGLQQQLADQSDAAPPAPLTPEQSEAEQRCSQGLADALAPHKAPTAVQQRFASLLTETAADASYGRSVAAWRSCLASGGFQAETPFSISNLAIAS